jgi:hypothetical protein
MGFLKQLAYVNSMGTAQDLAPLGCDNLATQLGRHLGNAAGLLQGIAEGSSGSGMLGGGVVACLTTGVGCAATPLATAGGVALVGHGSAVSAVATSQELLLATRVLMASLGGGSSSGSGSGSGNQDPTVQPGYPGGTGTQTGNTQKNADRLRVNLNAAGRPQPGKGMAAHHIVHSTYSYAAAQQSRAILGRFGVDINDAVNGVWVTVSQNSKFNSYRYMDTVFSELRSASSRADALDILEDIRMRIRGFLQEPQ